MGWILITVSVLVIFVFITPVQIMLNYGRIGENDQADVELSAWFRLIRKKYQLPIVLFKQSEAGPELVAKVETVGPKGKTKEKVKDLTRRQVNKWYRDYHNILEKVHDLQPLFRQFFKHIRCTKLEWHTVLGTGQASETGALTGVIWGVKSMIIGVMAHSLSLRVIPKMSVQPVWNQTLIHSQFHCVLQVTLGHVIVVAAKMFIRMRKSRIRKWRTATSEA